MFYLNFFNANKRGKAFSDNLSCILHYFVEDNVAITAAYTWSYLYNRNGVNLDYVWEDNNNYNNLSIGFTYYIDRGLIF